MSDDWGAPYPAEEPGGKGKKGRSGAHPNAVAARILCRWHEIEEPELQHDLLTDAAGIVYRYNGAHWAPIGEAHLNKIVYDAEGPKLSMRPRRTEIISALRAMTMAPDHEWGRLPEWELPFANGVLDLTSGGLRPHDRDDFLERVIPWDYVPDARSALWEDRCLPDWLGETPDPKEGAGRKVLTPERLDLADALQEFFGYCQMPHARYKRALVLLGESDTGKTVPLLVLMHMIGRRATCSLSVESMDDPVLRAVIVGKGLNVVTELPASAVVRDGAFKQLVSTEEPIMINEKNVPAYMYLPTAKHVIATNKLPGVNDRSEAFFGRLLIIPFDNVLVEQDRGLLAKLTSPEHMPGIVAWAARGARRLYERGGLWPRPALSAQLLARYREDQNPATRFLEECFVADPANAEPVSVMLKHFNAWMGGKRTDMRDFTAMLRKAYPWSNPDPVTKAGSKKGIRKARTVLFDAEFKPVLAPDGRMRKSPQASLAIVGLRYEGLPRHVSFTIDEDEPTDAPDEVVAVKIMAGKEEGSTK